jgi:predicted DNA-binding protein (MmcQ/YjbR family)
MPQTSVTDFCTALPGAELTHPFGPQTDTWKVGGKIFALVSGSGEGVVLKCGDAEQAAFLIDIGVARPAPYLKRGGWVLIPWEILEAGAVDAADMDHRLRQSYDTVVAGLPKRLRPRPPGDDAGVPVSGRE